MSRIGDAIREARQAAGISQKDLAERMDVSAQYLCDMESGKRPVPLFRLLEIANQFPDVDSIAWMWLLAEDLWGKPTVDAMKAWAVAEDAREWNR